MSRPLIGLLPSLALFVVPAVVHAQDEGGEEDLGDGGVWIGKAGFIEQDNLVVEPSILDVVDQDRRRFFGEMMVGETDFSIVGTASDADVVSIVGASDFGTAAAVTDVQTFEGGAALMFGGLRLDPVGRKRPRSTIGLQMLMRQFDFDPESEDPPPSVAGVWDGTFTSAIDGTEGDVGGNFERTLRTSLTRFIGSLSIGGMDMNVVEFDTLEGSINSDGEIVLIGMSDLEDGLFVILHGQLVIPPPRDVGPPPAPIIGGTYQVYAGGMDMNVHAGGLDMNLLDFGTVQIIAILIG